MSSAPEAVAHSTSAQLLWASCFFYPKLMSPIYSSSYLWRTRTVGLRNTFTVSGDITAQDILICLPCSIQGYLEGLKLQPMYYCLHVLKFNARGDSTQQNELKYWFVIILTRLPS